MTADESPDDEALRRSLEARDLASLDRLAKLHGPAFVRMGDDPAKLTSLHFAAASGSTELVLYLLAPPVSADPRAAHGNRFTPLHAAAMNGHAAICDTLLKVGADVNAQTEPQGYAPLHSAAFAGHLAAIQALLDHGANRALRNYRGETPAMTAARTGQQAAYELLNANSGTNEPH